MPANSLSQMMKPAGLLTALILLLSACSQNDDPLHHTQMLALGTLVDVSLWDVDEEQATAIIQTLQADFNHINSTWHAWKDSQLTHFNHDVLSPEGASLDPEATALLLQAQILSHASNHLFNPAIGRMIALWGFHSDTPPQGPPPTPAAIKALINPMPTMDDLSIKAGRWFSQNPQLQLDFGAFAKGYAVDIAMNHIKEAGISNAIVNAGGDLRVIGSHGKRPWRIGIRHPDRPGVIASIETQGDESIFTSGHYERYYEYSATDTDKPIRYHHLIDPRSGQPARGIASVTVIHNNAATADAAATALFIAGIDQWQKIARQMGIQQVMLIDDKMGIYMTTTMAKRLHFEIDTPKIIQISEP